jgi:hypothetical protein
MTNEELFALIKKNPISFACGALTIGLAVALYFRSDAIPEAEAKLTERAAVAEKYTLNITNSAQLKDQYDDLLKANKDIDARIVRASQLGVNYQYFQKLRSDTGVTVVDFGQTTPGNVAKPAKGSFLPVAFRVTVQGTFAQLMDYVRLVEGGTNLGRIRAATLSGNSAKRDTPLTLALTVDLLGIP